MKVKIIKQTGKILINESSFGASQVKGTFGKPTRIKYRYEKYSCVYSYRGHMMYHTNAGVTEGKTGLLVYSFSNSKDPKFPYRKNTANSFTSTAKWLEHIFTIEDIDFSVNKAIKQIGEIPQDHINYYL